jgi:hypothetical protein
LFGRGEDHLIGDTAFIREQESQKSLDAGFRFPELRPGVLRQAETDGKGLPCYISFIRDIVYINVFKVYLNIYSIIDVVCRLTTTIHFYAKLMILDEAFLP